ncbi:Chromate transport protein [Caloramator mitchellensis]|uniref:Chromate transport protein n=1 Tax=Caloramator mitchellensis TaxID=908809 RepID=A0A0R3JSS6_CALMK|nr:chromate transporter [Caloramator mitchellensis]KRQ86566.1 Chromate transport protein [Caloramator mitchellensis]
MIIYKLFITFFKIGLFSFGGGYAMLPLIQQQVVFINKWLTQSEFIDIVAISQITPGPIAINSATYIGYKVGGFWGSLISTTGVSLPSVLVMMLIIKFIEKFKKSDYMEAAFSILRPTVLGLILAAALSITQSSVVDIKGAIVFLTALAVSLKFKIDPIAITIIGGILGYVLYK